MRDWGATLGPVPAGAEIVFLPGTVRPRAGVVYGGAPWRLLRVSERADRLLDAWSAGEPVPDDPAARALAGRLVDAGMVTVRAGTSQAGAAGTVQARDPDAGAPDAGLAGTPTTASVTVVIPVRDRPAGLAATLDHLDAGAEVIVVDDGSRDATEVAATAHRRPGTRVVRRPAPGGPAAARNAGWRTADREIVAFLDADCVPPPGWLDALVGHFSDPLLAAVAPRVQAWPAPGTPSWLAAYEACRSPLDLGPTGGPARPRAAVPYVPTAALLVRRAALDGAGGFDEERRTGEDVDLVWRLAAGGWRVRYDPSVVVRHPVRPSLGPWLRQRFGYGRSAAPLAARHGDAVAPLVVDRSAGAGWLLAAAGHPVAGAALAAAGTAALAAPMRESQPLSPAEITRLAALGQAATGRGIAAALRRSWWPALLVAAGVSPRARRVAAVAAVVPPALAWRRERPRLDPGRWVALCAADDLAYGAGVWAGAVAQRSARCLLPALTGPALRSVLTIGRR